MKLRISSFADKGDFNKERIVLKVLADTNVGNFVLMQTGFNGQEVTTSVFHTFWFPYKEVFGGDLVVIYTKAGKDREKAIEGNRTAHFYYWGLESTIWEGDNQSAVLLEAPEWESKNPTEG
jgi:hypothetical protein